MAITPDKVGSFFLNTDQGASVPPQLSQILVDISRPGVDGSAYRKESKKSPIVQWQNLIAVTSSGTIETAAQAIADLVGTVVTLRYRTQSYTNYLVVHAEVGSAKLVATTVGLVDYTGSPITAGNSAYLMDVRFVLQKATETN